MDVAEEVERLLPQLQAAFQRLDYDASLRQPDQAISMDLSLQSLIVAGDQAAELVALAAETAPTLILPCPLCPL